MPLTQDSHSPRVHPSVFSSTSSKRKGAPFKRELSVRIEAVKKQNEAVRFATEMAYVLPTHVGVVNVTPEDEKRCQLHLLTHMVEHAAQSLDDLVDWVHKLR